jgi:hypothetical protein
MGRGTIRKGEEVDHFCGDWALNSNHKPYGTAFGLLTLANGRHPASP